MPEPATRGKKSGRGGADRTASADRKASARQLATPPHTATPSRTASADHVIQALASEQHAVVGRRQLLDRGVTPDEVAGRIRAGWLRRIHRGVYCVGPVAAPRTHLMAAVLACGPASWISHRSAGRLFEMLPPRGPSQPVDVTVGRADRRRPGIRVRRVGTMPLEETTTLGGIPVTTVPRTLLDLAAVLPSRDLERAYREALARGLTTPARLEALLGRHRGRRGSPALRALLTVDPPAATRSDAEERLLELIRVAKLPTPETNARLRGFEVDFLWRRHRLIVEVDGFAFHSSRTAFEADRRRDAILLAAGYRVQRVTWRQLQDGALSVVANLAAALAVGS